MLSKKVALRKRRKPEGTPSTYGTRYFSETPPSHEMREEGMPANAAYQLVHDELNLDCNPALNLASFVTTWMEPEADKLIAESLNKNFIDHDEYPETEVIHERVVNMLARLFNAPEKASFVGTSTIGSSEAVLLALLAHKWTWRKRRQAKGKPYDRPNIVMGADVHIVWHKFARYFDVEPRVIPMSPRNYVLDVAEVERNIDENTICVGCVFGTTFTGQSDPIEKINNMLLRLKKRKGWDIPIHVDAASGGFIAPFTRPKLKWDFRLPQVKSINVSGHKYGLVYPGVGWLIFRDKKYLPEELIFHVNYLGGRMPTYTLNFSKGSSMIVAQYYNFLRLGVAGYRQIMSNTLKNARYLARELLAGGRFELINDGRLFPVILARLKGKPNFTVFDLSHRLRERGWTVPAYTLPPKADHVSVLRIVVKENFSRDMVEALIHDVTEACSDLGGLPSKKAKAPVDSSIKHRVC